MKLTVKRLLHRAAPLALAAALLAHPALAAGQPAVSQDWTSPFSDVSEGQWFYAFVGALNSQGVVNGYDDGRFGPNDATRAGDAMIMILKAAGVSAQEAPQGAHYAAGYANYAVEQGWLTPEQVPADLSAPISRLAIAQLAAQALGLTPSESPSPFADAADGMLTALYQCGIVAGTQAGEELCFYPDASITRAEVSAIVWQVQEYSSHIHFGTHTLDILSGVPVNSYDTAAFALEGDRMTYVQEGVTTQLGVDVSAYQGTIDWPRVAKDGVDFAMLRAGGRYYGLNSGTIYEDSKFRTNLQGALDAGLDVGVYFFSQAITVDEAREEARFVLELIRDYDVEGPVVFDWENISGSAARTDGVDSVTLTAMANAFCQEVAAAGRQPMIYFNRYIAYLLYDLEGIAQYPLWLAEYSAVPSFYYDFQMWQYTDNGQVDGITGRVDLNLRIFPEA